MKRWVSWVLALAMVTMTLLPASAEAMPQRATPETAAVQELETQSAEDAITGTYGVLTYTVNEDGTSCTIKACDTAAEGELEIPEEIDGYKVTGIGYNAFYDCSSLTSISIPDGVTSIESWAFEDCTSLTSINIPDGVTIIDNATFHGCSSLTSISIPEGVTSIGQSIASSGVKYGAFSGCSSLTSINIPDSVTNIGKYTFSDCSSLTSINIPDSVTNIGGYAFFD